MTRLANSCWAAYNDKAGSAALVTHEQNGDMP